MTSALRFVYKISIVLFCLLYVFVLVSSWYTECIVVVGDFISISRYGKDKIIFMKFISNPFVFIACHRINR